LEIGCHLQHLLPYTEQNVMPQEGNTQHEDANKIASQISCMRGMPTLGPLL
jgi:hypothetical protein